MWPLITWLRADLPCLSPFQIQSVATRGKTGNRILLLSQSQSCLCSWMAYHTPLQLIKLKKQTHIFKPSSHWCTFMDRVLISIQFSGERVSSTNTVSAVSLQYKFCRKQECSSPWTVWVPVTHTATRRWHGLNIDQGLSAPLMNPSRIICENKGFLRFVPSFMCFCLSALHTHKPLRGWKQNSLLVSLLIPPLFKLILLCFML